jgi:predicted nucleic acid-binding protein
MVVWWGTVGESWSALARLRRNRFIETSIESEASTQLEALSAAWHEVTPSRAVRRHAHRLLRVHDLRAADALQLAAALVWSGDESGSELVTFDARLAEVARVEGFAIA